MPSDTSRVSRHRALRESGTLVPGVALAVVSKFTCAACLSAYAGILSSLGLGFVASDRGLTMFTALALALGVLSIAWTTRRHRNIGPLFLTGVGSAVVLAGRLYWPVLSVLYGGTAVVIAAAFWNLWLVRRHGFALVEIRSADKGNTKL